MAKSDRYLKEKVKQVASSIIAELAVSKSAQKLHSRCDVVRDGRRHRAGIVKSWRKGIVCPDWRMLVE